MARTLAPPILLYFAFSLSATLAQTPPPPAALAGTVTNSLTGEPILRAHVTARCTSEPRTSGEPQVYGALTNAKGEFSIAPLPSGNCNVNADRVGFVPTMQGENYKLASGTHREDLKLAMAPSGAITGLVLNAAGDPMQHVAVTAEGAGMSKNATTDDKGQFRIGGLRAGKYRVRAAPQAMPFPPEIRSDGTQEMQDAATYYGDALNAKAAQRVEVRPGADMSGVDIRLVRTPIVTVSGKVTGIPDGTKNVGIEVRQSVGFGTSTQQSGSNVKPDGTFVIWRLNPGKYALVAVNWMATNGQTRLQSAPVDIEVNTSNLEHLELHMVPAFDLAGQMRFEDEQARQPAAPPVRAGQPPRPPQPRRLSLQAVDFQGQGSDSPIAADDTFTLEKVQPGLYHVNITWGPAYVKSVRMGDTESEGSILDVRNGAAGPLTVTLSSNTCEVSGTVSNTSGPVANAQVALGLDQAQSGLRLAHTDATGAYKFTALPPGKYRLVLLDPQSNAGGFRPQLLDDYDDVAEKLDLSPGDKITKDLKRDK